MWLGNPARRGNFMLRRAFFIRLQSIESSAVLVPFHVGIAANEVEPQYDTCDRNHDQRPKDQWCENGNEPTSQVAIGQGRFAQPVTRCLRTPRRGFSILCSSNSILGNRSLKSNDCRNCERTCSITHMYIMATGLLDELALLTRPWHSSFVGPLTPARKELYARLVRFAQGRLPLLQEGTDS